MKDIMSAPKQTPATLDFPPEAEVPPTKVAAMDGKK
jgi:hypothetical protein